LYPRFDPRDTSPEGLGIPIGAGNGSSSRAAEAFVRLPFDAGGAEGCDESDSCRIFGGNSGTLEERSSFGNWVRKVVCGGVRISSATKIALPVVGGKCCWINDIIESGEQNPHAKAYLKGLPLGCGISDMANMRSDAATLLPPALRSSITWARPEAPYSLLNRAPQSLFVSRFRPASTAFLAPAPHNA
jgi:hypothetical protein